MFKNPKAVGPDRVSTGIYKLNLWQSIIATIVVFLSFAPAAFALDAPTITPTTGSFIAEQTVTMNAAAGTIYFTTDGTVPNATSSTQYTAPFVITTPTQLNAVAFQSGTYSSVTTAYLDVDPNIAPLFPNNRTTFTMSGTINAGDIVSVTVYNGNIKAGSGQPAGTRTYSRQVLSTDTLASIASALKTSFANDSEISSAGIQPAYNPGQVYFWLDTLLDRQSNVPTAYTQSVTPSGNEVITRTGGLTLRLRGGFGVSTGLGSPASVTRWADLSGNGYDAVSTAGSAPTLLTFGSNKPPVINFNGNFQYLSLPPGFANFTTLHQGIPWTGLTLFVVMQPTAITSGARIIDFGNGSSGNNILLRISDSGSYGQFWTYNGTSGTSVQSANSLTPNQYVLLEGTQYGNTGKFYLNSIAGSTNSSMSSIQNTNRASNFIGQASASGNFYTGNIAEILLYSTPLSTTLSESDRSAIEAYLMQRYQLTSTTPAAPIFSVPGGVLSGPTQVVISTDPNTQTHITTDGTTPTSSSPAYSGCPITINYSQTLKAISIRNGISSTVTSATYTLDSTQWPAPSPSDTTAPSINLQLPTATQ